MFFGETLLSQGTAFFWKADQQLFLITNWHNASGKDPFTGKHLSNTLAEPNRLRVWWNVKDRLGDKIPLNHLLRDDEGRPLWFVHPRLGSAVDAVALPLIAPPNVEPYAVNGLPEMAIRTEIGNDLFILGYPYGIGPGGLPVWKRGSLASEPDIADPSRPFTLIDTASRPGMSGSPIIRRAWATVPTEDGGVSMITGAATRFFGIYSGRIHSSDPLDAELGLAWRRPLLEEIIAQGVRDT